MANGLETIYLTESAFIAGGPLEVFAIDFTPATTGQGVILYDDRWANDERKKLHLHNLTTVFTHGSYNPPLSMNYGLYVELETGVTEVTINIRRLAE